MSKKDALTMACEELTNILYEFNDSTFKKCKGNKCPACIYCKTFGKQKYNYNDCCKTIKQYFQESTIPDGWDVIRRTCKEIQKIWFDGLNPHNYFDKYGGYKDCEEKGVGMCLKHFEEQLKQAGIEVDDVCK